MINIIYTILKYISVFISDYCHVEKHFQKPMPTTMNMNYTGQHFKQIKSIWMTIMCKSKPFMTGFFFYNSLLCQVLHFSAIRYVQHIVVLK